MPRPASLNTRLKLQQLSLWSAGDIAQYFGCSRATAYRILNEVTHSDRIVKQAEPLAVIAYIKQCNVLSAQSQAAGKAFRTKLRKLAS